MGAATADSALFPLQYLYIDLTLVDRLQGYHGST